MNYKAGIEMDSTLIMTLVHSRDGSEVGKLI